MADKIELAKAYVSIIPSMEGAQETIAESLGGAADAAGAKAGDSIGGGALAGLTDKLSKFVMPAALLTSLGTAAKAAFELGANFDEGFDAIATGTGATGAALEDLENSAKNVASVVPASFGDVADTLAELNTRTGATGKSLEDLTLAFAQLDEIGYTADVDTVTGAMNAWGISADQMDEKLDELFIVSQSTGQSIDQLAGSMSENASTAQALGLSFEEAAAMSGLFDKAGLSSSGMMSKLSKAMTTLAKDGKEPAAAFEETMEAIQGFLDAGDRASAVSLATDLFGTRGAAQFVQAVETGAMDVEALEHAMLAANGAIEQNAESTRSFGESFDIFKNKVQLALEPLASGVFDAASAGMELVIEAFEWLSNAAQEAYNTLMENEDVQAALGAIQEALGVVWSVGQEAFAALQEGAAFLMPILQPLAEFIGGVLLSRLSALAQFISSVVVVAFEAIRSKIQSVRDKIQALSDFFAGLKLELPHFSIPHFRIDGGELPWGIGGKGYPPSINVDWYAKGGIVDGATLIGAGEAGAEAIVPLYGREMKPFADAIAANLRRSNSAGNTYNINMNIQADSQTTLDSLVKQAKRAAVAYGRG